MAIDCISLAKVIACYLSCFTPLLPSLSHPPIPHRDDRKFCFPASTGHWPSAATLVALKGALASVAVGLAERLIAGPSATGRRNHRFCLALGSSAIRICIGGLL